MPRGRTKGDHEAKRAEIAEAACQVILRLGIAQTSLSEISREMGYTTGILRHYFADKDELLLYAKNLFFDRSFERARAAAIRHNGIEKLRAMAVSLLPSDAESIDRYRLLATFNGHAIGNSRLMKLQQKRNARHWHVFEEVIRALIESGDLPEQVDPRLEACGILAMIDGLADQIIMEPGAWAADELVTLLSRHIEALRKPAAAGAAQAARAAKQRNA